MLKEEPVVGVCCGGHRSFVMLEDRSLYGFGKGLCFGTDPTKRFFHTKLLFKDASIKKIACGSVFLLLEKEDGQLIYSDRNCTQKLDLKKAEILVQGTCWKSREWTAETHKDFPLSFRVKVMTVFCCLRERGIKTPKFILFQIINQMK